MLKNFNNQLKENRKENNSKRVNKSITQDVEIHVGIYKW